jgi:hypothetical protein
MKPLVPVLAALLLVQPALAQTVIDSDFTISVPNGQGEPIVESTTLVPLLEGSCFHWHLRFAKTKGDVEVVEIYRLPAAPALWELGDDSMTVIAGDRRSATTPRLLTPDDGWIGSGWCVSDGDPEGAYSFEILHGEEVLGRFDFQLKEL